MERLSLVSFRDLRIRTKLAVGFGAVIVVLATIATIGALSAMTVRDSAEKALDRDARLNAIALELEVHVANAQKAAATFRFDAARGGARAASDTAERSVASELSAARSLVTEARSLAPAGNIADVDLIAAKLDEFEGQFKQVLDAVRLRGDGSSGREGDFRQAARSIEDTLGSRTGVERALAAALISRRSGEEYLAAGGPLLIARAEEALTALKSEVEASPAFRAEEKMFITKQADASVAALREIVRADGIVISAGAGFESVSSAVTGAANRLAAASKTATAKASNDISDTSAAAVRNVTAVSAIGVLMAALLVIVLSRTITGPLGSLAAVSNRMSLGELDVNIDVHSKDEVGQLADSLRRMQASLRAAIERLRARRAA